MSLLNMNLIPTTTPSDTASSLASSALTGSASNSADGSDSFDAHLSRVQSTSSSASADAEAKENNSRSDSSRPSPATRSNNDSQPKVAKSKSKNKNSSKPTATESKEQSSPKPKPVAAESKDKSSSKDSNRDKEDDTQDTVASCDSDPLAAALAAATSVAPMIPASDSSLPAIPTDDALSGQAPTEIDPTPSDASTRTDNTPQLANDAQSRQTSAKVNPTSMMEAVDVEAVAATAASSATDVSASNVSASDAMTTNNNKAVAANVGQKKGAATSENQDSSSPRSSAAINAAAINPAVMPLPELSASQETPLSDKKSDDDSIAAVKGPSATSATDIQGSPSASAAKSPSGDSSQAANGSAQGTTPAADQVDRTRFVQRVANAFEAMSDRSGSVRVRLSPPELGSMRLEITYRNGTVNARVQTDTTAARDILMENLPALRDRLAQQHIKVERFDVNVSDRSSGGSDQQSMYGQAHSQPQWPNPTRSSAQPSDTQAVGAIASNQEKAIFSDEGGLNVLI